MYWFAFDSMGEFAFNQDFGMMRRQEWHFAITLFRRALALIGPFSPAVWLIKIGFAFVPWFWNIGAWFGMLSFCNKQLEARTKVGHRSLIPNHVFGMGLADVFCSKTKPPERDIASYFIEEAETRGHSEFMQRWMQGDTATVIVAGSAASYTHQLIRIGSDTTAPTLTFLFYLMARNPEDANKIYAELADIDPMDLNAVSTLPHLNGTINEAMRLYSVAPTTVSRQTPPQGVRLGNTWIPGNTKVISPRWVIFR
ncbi:MAG: hypothetical protein Q9210_002004, partial [Variospora velana]